MQITKVGHCCLVIDIDGVRLLTDPGAWTTGQNVLKNIDAMLITHEHADHFHVDSVRAIVNNNPSAVIFTNQAVGKLLDQEKIVYQIVEDGQEIDFKTISLSGHGQKHAEIYSTIRPVQNTGYLIAKKLFYPGDALDVPAVTVDTLALPVAGPWLKISEAIDYAKKVHPKTCFPVHDGMLKITGPFHMLPQKELTAVGINFIIPEEGTSFAL